MLLAAKPGRKRAVVIGGGLLGLEAAVGLTEQGMDVTVLHLMPTLMERQLDPPAGHLLKAGYRAPRHRVITKANTKAILGRRTRPPAVRARLDDGTELPADLVVMAVGIRPNTDLAKRRRPRQSSAASSSTTTCAPTTPTSTRWANASKHRGAVLRPGRAAL